jgi:hypothetical protein
LRRNPPSPGRPIPCLRLKLLQKGLDDFEYLHILQARLERQFRAQKLKNPQAYAQARMRQLAGQVVLDINSFDLDPRKLQATRAQVAAEIDQLGE